jgi:hypothetical protein
MAPLPRTVALPRGPGTRPPETRKNFETMAAGCPVFISVIVAMSIPASAFLSLGNLKLRDDSPSIKVGIQRIVIPSLHTSPKRESGFLSRVTCNWVPSKRDSGKDGAGSSSQKRSRFSPGNKKASGSDSRKGGRQGQWRGEAPFPKLQRKITSAQPGEDRPHHER